MAFYVGTAQRARSAQYERQKEKVPQTKAKPKKRGKLKWSFPRNYSLTYSLAVRDEYASFPSYAIRY